MGTAYIIWTGIGALGAVLAGIIVFNEPKDAMRLVFAGFILVGIIGFFLIFVLAYPEHLIPP